MNNLGDLLPAYGRDYKTAKQAKEAFKAGEDWIISSMFHPYSGKSVNIDQLKQDPSVGSVFLRFCNKTKLISVKVN